MKCTCVLRMVSMMESCERLFSACKPAWVVATYSLEFDLDAQRAALEASSAGCEGAAHAGTSPQRHGALYADEGTAHGAAEGAADGRKEFADTFPAIPEHLLTTHFLG
jgi:hypothetical protein